MDVLESVGINILSNIIYDISKHIIGDNQHDLKKIDKIINSTLSRKYKNLFNSELLNKLLKLTSIKDLIEKNIIYNISNNMYTNSGYVEKNYDIMTIDYLYSQIVKECKKENYDIPDKNQFFSFFIEYFNLADSLLYTKLNNNEKIQVNLLNKSIKQTESNIIFFIQQLQSNIERLIDIEPIDKIKKYHQTVTEYHKILKDKKRKERVYLLDKIEFSKFYVSPLLRQKIKYNEEDIQYNVRSYAGDKEIFRSYDEWKYIFDYSNFVYIVGGPGYGKSLFLTKIINDSKKMNFLNNEDYLIIYGDLKTFKHTNGPTSMLEYLQNCMIKETLMDKKYITKDLIEYYINSGRCMVLFDALDEVEKDIRNDLHETIASYFNSKNPNNKICITSRSRGFIPESNHIVYEILPLEGEQIEKYLDKLINIGKFDENDKNIFLDQATILINNHFLNSFLILSLLLHIFKAERSLPDTKLDLYEKCFSYIAYRREKDKSQKYDWKDLYGIMNNSTFGLLANMGLPNNKDIDRQDIIDVMCKNYTTRYGTVQATALAAENFLTYCSERTELFILSKDEDKFHFFHRSFFEYFYSNYLLFQIEIVEKIFDGLRQFDVDSEIFELTFALIKQTNELKYQKLINYIFKKCFEELEVSNINKISAFNILTLGMSVITDVEYRDRYIDFLISNKEFIINQSKLVNDRIYEVIISNNEYCEKIIEEYENEAKLMIFPSLFSVVFQAIRQAKRINNIIEKNKILSENESVDLSMSINNLKKDIESEITYYYNNYYNNCFYCNLYFLQGSTRNFFYDNINYKAINYLKNNNCFIENKMIDENCIKLYDQYDDLNDRLKNVIEYTVNITLKDLLEMSK